MTEPFCYPRIRRRGNKTGLEGGRVFDFGFGTDFLNSQDVGNGFAVSGVRGLDAIGRESGNFAMIRNGFPVFCPPIKRPS